MLNWYQKHMHTLNTSHHVTVDAVKKLNMAELIYLTS